MKILSRLKYEILRNILGVCNLFLELVYKENYQTSIGDMLSYVEKLQKKGKTNISITLQGKYFEICR